MSIFRLTLVVIVTAIICGQRGLMADTIFISSAPPSEITAGVGQNVDVYYTFTAPDYVAGIGASIDWGDGSAATSLSWSGGGSNSVTLGATHDYSAEGDYTLSLTGTGSSYSIQTEIVGYHEVQTGEQWISNGFGEGYYQPIYTNEPTYGQVNVGDANSAFASQSDVVVNGVVAAPLPGSDTAGLMLFALCGLWQLRRHVVKKSC